MSQRIRMVSFLNFDLYIFQKCRAGRGQRRIFLGFGGEVESRIRTGIEIAARIPLAIGINTNGTSDETSIILEK